MQVKITDPRWASKDAYFFAIEQWTTFEGTELKPPKWVDAAENLVLSTTNPEFPFRILSRKWIVEIDGAPYSIDKPTHRTVVVPGSKNNSYTVTFGETASCDCSGFTFRKTCKHIAIAAAAK